MTAESPLERRIARLEALQAIAALKARYAALADAKYTSAYERVPEDEWRRLAGLQAECFTDDARWDGGPQFGGVLRGRAALAGWFARSPWRFALHYYVAQELALTGDDAAEGRWRLWQVGLPLDTARPVLLAAITAERYRLVRGAWLVARMRFTEIHTLDLGAAPPELRCLIPRETP